MRKTRGFRLKIIKLVKIFKLASRPRNSMNPFSKLFSMARRSLQAVSSQKVGYIRMGRVEPKPLKAPKGQLAVYVGESEDETERHLVPVIYFNHPMFGKLLKKVEIVYGFDNPGRIMIPCEVSEFERVKNNIAAAEYCRRRRRRCSHNGCKHW